MCAEMVEFFFVTTSLFMTLVVGVSFDISSTLGIRLLPHFILLHFCKSGNLDKKRVENVQR